MARSTATQIEMTFLFSLCFSFWSVYNTAAHTRSGSTNNSVIVFLRKMLCGCHGWLFHVPYRFFHEFSLSTFLILCSIQILLHPIQAGPHQALPDWTFLVFCLVSTKSILLKVTMILSDHRRDLVRWDEDDDDVLFFCAAAPYHISSLVNYELFLYELCQLMAFQQQWKQQKENAMNLFTICHSRIYTTVFSALNLFPKTMNSQSVHIRNQEEKERQWWRSWDAGLAIYLYLEIVLFLLWNH